MTAGDGRFFARSGPYGLAEVARAAGGVAVGELMLTGVAPLASASGAEVAFLDNRRYTDALVASRAGAVIVHPDLAAKVPVGTIPIVTREPYLGWARVAALFHPEPPGQPGIHPLALIDLLAAVDQTAEIGPFAVVGANAEIGPRCRVGAGATIGQGVRLGTDCRIGEHVTISHALLGDRVRVYPGARIGQDGFGFASSAAGFVSIPQLGRVILEDDVEIGANTTVDRGSASDTVIGAGSRLDNLVQIGHNVRLGRCCVIVAQVGISGSTTLGDFVQVGGQAAFAGHLKIGDKARIGAKAGVMANLPEGAEVLGSPAMPVKAFFRQVAVLKRLAERRGDKVSGAATPAADTKPG